MAGLTPNTTYDCFIRSNNVYGASCSAATAVTTYSVPAPTTNVTAVDVYGTALTLAWNDGMRAVPTQTYEAKCVAAGANCTAPTVGRAVPPTVAYGVQRAVLTNLTQDTPYSCYVVASNAAGQQCSSALAVKTAAVPRVPTNVTAVEAGNGAVSVLWNDNNGQTLPAPSFTAKCVSSNAACNATAQGAGAVSVAAGVQSGVVTGLLAGTAYTCYVVATTPAGTACSAPASVVTYDVPYPPSYVSAWVYEGTKVSMWWSEGPPSMPAELYRVRCVLAGAGCNGTAQGTITSRIPRGTQTGTVTGLSPATTFDCYVRVSNAAGKACSPGVTVTTRGAPPKPSILDVYAASTTSVAIAWAENALLYTPTPSYDTHCTLQGSGCNGSRVGVGQVKQEKKNIGGGKEKWGQK